MTMDSNSASNTIASYRKRQQRGPIIIKGLAALFIIIGIIILIVWLTGDNKPQMTLFATETPTPTLTSTVTVTSSPTPTSTYTLTPTVTLTPTASVPFTYTVQENESLATISEKFNLGDNGVLLLFALNPLVEERGGIVYVAEEIMVPNPGMKLPTATPVPVDLPKGTLLDYTILPGDSIAAIAVKFHSIEEAILEENEIENANAIQAFQVIVVPANLITPEPTRLPPTSPPDSTATPTAAPIVNTPAPPPVASCGFQENQDYIAQIFELTNNERVTRGLSPLILNDKLSAAALVHASDMACNSFYKEVGSDGTTLEEQVAAQGYTASLVLYEIHAQPPEYGGDGQAAFTAWMGSSTLLNANVTEIGIAYAYSEDSALGGYFTVILATP